MSHLGHNEQNRYACAAQDPKFCSHEFKSNGLKYEVGVYIQSGNIVCDNGPFCGGENDLTIAHQAVIGT
jgi:hypothetical protein